jgi:TolB-like protein/class 3 adenylate cyclase
MTEERVKRKISAILSADVAGYSRLMGEDEVSTVWTLEAYRKVMSDLIEQFRGRVVDSPGDNLLAEFSSVVDAVQCAVEIHEVIRAKNEELPEDRRMLFRIGVNLGDVIEEGDRIYGDGVNIAARLEGLAEAGGICISGSAHEQIENKLALGYEYLGEHTVKNIAKPVKVYRVPMGQKAITPKEGDEKKTKLKNWQLTALGAAGAIIVIIGALAIWYFSFRQAPVVVEVEKEPKTIAVLPFENLSSDPEQVYFADGLSEEILNSLAQIPDLTVIARTSSFSFKGTNKTIQEIANVLGVDNILEGSVRKAGNAIRITAQLVKAVDGSHLWSKTYDRELKDIFAVQEDIAAAVADELKLTLGISDTLKQLGGTDNLQAYELYLIAQGQLKQIGSDLMTDNELIAHYKATIKVIDTAITIDPDFALAWILKASIHTALAANSPPGSVAAEQNSALKAIQTAIEIEPGLAEAYAAMGVYRTQKGDLLGAESANIKAFELTNKPWSLGWGIGVQYLTVGHLERANEIYEAVKLNDPFNETNRTFYIISIGCLGDMQGAEEEYKRCMTLFGDPWNNGNWAISFLRLSKDKILSVDDIPHSNLIFDTLKAHMKSQKDALAQFHQIYTDNDNLTTANFADMSVVVAYLGDPELSMDAMEKAYSIDNSRTSFIWFPVMREVRQTSRFKEFVRGIGLVDYWKTYGWPDLCHPIGDDDFECN